MLQRVGPNRNRPGDREAGVDWLLDPAYPAVRRLTLVRLLGRDADDPDVREIDGRLAKDPWVATLLAGSRRDGIQGVVRAHPYKKWGGAHWRLVTLAELGVTVRIPEAGGPIADAFASVTGWLLDPRHVRRVPRIEGRYRRCGSQEGIALWAACRLGVGADDELDALASNLMHWQWPDGGWNCDVRPAASHSSFNESWAPLRALVAYRERRAARTARGPGRAELNMAIERAAEFFLRHRVVESERTGRLAHEALAKLRWPPYWHYGLLPGLRVLQAADRLSDPRVRPAVDRLLALRRPDGRWHPNGRWWHASTGDGANVEIVDWGAEGEVRMLTLHATEVVAGTGRAEGL